jgi:Zn-dependent protease
MEIEQIIVIAFYLVSLLYSIILHEISHGAMAMWLGDYTAKNAGRLTLEPIRHIDPIGSIILPLLMIFTTGFAFGWAKPVPYNPYALRGGKWGEVLVAFAGPIANFLIASVATIIAFFITISTSTKIEIINSVQLGNWNSLAEIVSGSVGNISFAILIMFIFWNILLGIFNLLPIPPLDGSKLLFALIPISRETRMFLNQWGIMLVMLFLYVDARTLGIFSFIMNSVLNLFFTLTI